MPQLSMSRTTIGMMILLIVGISYCFFNYSASRYTKAKKQVKAYYVSKNSHELVTEPVEWIVKVVYSDNPISRLLLPVSGYFGKHVTQYAHKVAHATDPIVVNTKIGRFQRLYKEMLDMHEYAVPDQGFKTFNDWFIRRFKDLEASRPMEPDVHAIVSPADSKLLIIPNLSQDLRIVIKEQRFNVAKFLGDVALAKQFDDGVMMIFRLAPYDYHRYHYPFDCFVGPEQCINGGYHSVNPRAFTAGAKPLTTNKRSYEVLTPVGTMHTGCTVAMVQVGATVVASIINEFMDYTTGRLKDAHTLYKKGQEMGYFQFGGSTIVLLFPKGAIVPDAQIVAHSQNGYETAVKVRETVATWAVQS
ncbi:phosphatidylserine decarboxylase [Candidatus Dependentiae bacterium]|nr:phosphatidylserine decarboxylase [Candidatus Dependentiae bacterium]MCC7415023.1 phosphatidylserine decarboxylase [Campylobacterota bacterium]